MKRIILAVTVAAATLAGPALAEQYVCETEQTIGFEYNTIIRNEWAQMRFRDDTRYLINTDTMTVSQFGLEGNVFEGDDCEMRSRAGQDPEHMRCLTMSSVISMTISVKLLRFVATTHGYVTGDEEDSIPAFVAIGTCAELGS